MTTLQSSHILLNPLILLKLSYATSQYLNNTELTTKENENLVEIVKGIDYEKIKHYPINTIITSLAKVAANKIKSQNNNNGNSKNNDDRKNSKESFSITKYEDVFDITQIFGVSDKRALLRVFNESALYEYSYIVLSTANSSTIVDNPYTFNWQIMENDTLGTGLVNIKPIKNIIGMRIYPIKFTYISPNTITAGNSSTMTEFAHYTILIQELIGQSILGYNNMRFHFVLTATRTTYNTQYLELVATRENNHYKFNPAITLLPSITLNIGDYRGKTNFPLSYLQALIYFVNPIQIYIPNATIALTTGMYCRFYNPVISNSGSAVNQAFILALTVGTGLPITVISSSLGYTRFTVALDGTVINPADLPTTVIAAPSTTVDVYIPASSSTIIPMCMISIKES